jgi:hypothetical protein
MGQFKPMVKMMTTEPTVELKLKKGGSAHKKMKHGGDADHKPMQSKMNGGIMGALSGVTPVISGTTAAPVARTPARPSMASRRRSMRIGKPAVSRVLSRTMKSGGDVEKELKAHASKPASKAHAGLNKGGSCYKDGGKVEATKGVIPVSASKKGAEKYVSNISTAEYATKTSGKTGDVKYGNGGGYKTGGVVLGNGGGYKKGGKACATGGVALGNAGGYKKGGASKKAYANGGSVNDEGKAVSMPQGNKKPSSPVSISKLSGTFKKGGTVAEKKLQGFFKKENATAMKESKAKLLDKYSPYQKADGGQVLADAERAAMYEGMKAAKDYDREQDIKIRRYLDDEHRRYLDDEYTGEPSSDDSFNKAVRSYKDKLRGQGFITDEERANIRRSVKYPSGMTDSDINKVIGSKEFKKSSSSFIDKKRGGKVGK